MKKSLIIGSVVAAVVVATGLSVLIWWLVTRETRYETIVLQGDGFSGVNHKAAFTRIHNSGDMFWLFYPTTTEEPASRPLVLWLDGVVGLPPSLLANFGMFGPLDLNLNQRDNSWVNDYNLLFVDAPLGTGFSTVSNDEEITGILEDNTSHLLLTLDSFYKENRAYLDTPLYIFGQGFGAQLALSLAQELHETNSLSANLKGVVLGNAIISPALVLTKLGFYLEELAYIDIKGREGIESLSENITNLVNQGQYGNAFDSFLGLNEFVNENAEAVAVNLAHIVEKVTNESQPGYFGLRNYLHDVTQFKSDFNTFMDGTVAEALGISDSAFDSLSEQVLQSFKDSLMTPAVDKVEWILTNTEITIAIYNGNLDAVSNTPGQLEWINNLQWSGQSEFLNSTRLSLVVNQIKEGYFRKSERLSFYWINVAGLTVPIDNPVGIRSVISDIMDN